MKATQAKKAASWKSVNGQPTPKPIDKPYNFPAPIRGWVLNENLATPSPASARVLDNWFPTTTGIRARGGARRYASLGSAVTSMFTYKAGATERMFAATASSVFDISSIVDPNAVPAAAFTGQTSGYYSTQPFGTAGGNFLYAVNGTDPARLFDGATWTQITGVSTPAITGVTTSLLSQVWSYANRLFFVEKNTLNAWYLPVDSIGGAAAKFSLAGVFQQGGSLLFGARWSLDAGNGLDDKCLFVTDKGEVAVYEGTNPASAADWRLAGLYTMRRPLGLNAYMQAGGDLLIATEAGLIPVSSAIKKDIAALELDAVSRAITPYWQQQAALITKPWEVLKLSLKNMMVVSQPKDGDSVGSVIVANLQTGAWARFTGWPATCMAEYGGVGYFGTDAGRVFIMEAGGSDDGTIYTCVYLGQHDTMGVGPVEKTLSQMRPTFRAGHAISYAISAKVDYDETLSAPPSSVANFTTSSWDSGVWDTAKWDDGTVTAVAPYWNAIGRSGFTIAPELQMSFGVTPTPLVELVGIDATFSTGTFVA